MSRHGTDAFTVENFNHLLYLCLLYLGFTYSNKIGLTIGGEIGCMIHQIVVCIVSLNFVPDFSPCASRIIVIVALDLVQFVWYYSLTEAMKTVLQALYNLLIGRNKIRIAGWKFMLSFIVLLSAIQSYNESNLFNFFRKRDLWRDILTAPGYLRDIEVRLCGMKSFFSSSSGCTFSFSLRKWY